MSGDRYDAIYRSFRWHVPALFNIAEACCGRWARETPDATAIVCDDRTGIERFSYGDLQRDADRLANALRRLGIERGDRVAIVMPQRFETAVAHIACYQLGAVAMPLSMLFGPDALEYRLGDSGARVAIADDGSIENVLAVRPACPRLQSIDHGRHGCRRRGRDWSRCSNASRPTSMPSRRAPTTRRC